MTPGSHPIRVNIILKSRAEPTPCFKNTAKGGNKMFNIIVSNDIIEGLACFRYFAQVSKRTWKYRTESHKILILLQNQRAGDGRALVKVAAYIVVQS